MMDLGKIELAAKRHASDPEWTGASIAYGVHVPPESVLQMCDLIRKQEAKAAEQEELVRAQVKNIDSLELALKEMQGRMGKLIFDKNTAEQRVAELSQLLVVSEAANGAKQSAAEAAPYGNSDRNAMKRRQLEAIAAPQQHAQAAQPFAFVADWMNKNGPYYHQPMEHWMEKIIVDFAAHIAPVASAPVVAVPEGWQLVPKEPTPEMVAHTDKIVPDVFSIGDEYRAMLSAAPQPAAAPVAAAVQGDGHEMSGDEARTKLADRLEQMLDAKELMQQRGVGANDFPEMFAEFVARFDAAQPPADAAPVDALSAANEMQIKQALTSYQQGRAAGIEEAAKLLDPKNPTDDWTPHAHVMADRAAAIRALAAKPAGESA